MFLVDTITLYLDDKQRKRTLSPNTIKQYSWAISKLAQWIGPDAAIEHLTPERLQGYFDYMLDVKHFTRTLHLQWVVLTGWQQWLVKSKRVPAPFLPDVELPSWTAPKPQHINDREAAALVMACAKIEDDYKRLLVTALMTVLTTTCLRHDEIINLQVKDVSVADYWIEVQKGKGDKYRRFKMADQCVDALRAYLAVRPKNCRHDYLFARTCAWRVGYEGLWNILEDVKALAGLSHADYIKPHRLRHAAASRQHHNGASVETMKAILGHSSILTTQIYLHTDESQMEAVRNFSALPLDPPKPPVVPPAPASVPQATPPPKYIHGKQRRPRRSAPLRLVIHDEDEAAS